MTHFPQPPDAMPSADNPPAPASADIIAPAGHAAQPLVPPPKDTAIDAAAIHALVHAFYDRVRDDPLLGPVFNDALDGHWDAHLAKMCDFWAGIVLGSKRYRGNVMQAHQRFGPQVTPTHFDRWLTLFLETANHLFAPAQAREFMVPALRIAHSLQLGLFGWQYELPAAQRALLEQLAPRGKHTGDDHANDPS